MKAMKIACALLCLSAVAAHADGMTASLKDQTAAVTRNSNCYLKAYGAGSFVNNKTDIVGASLNLGAENLGIGGGVGCDINQGVFLFGVFGDYTWNRANSNVAAGGVSLLNVPFGSEWSVGARAGVFASPSTLLYGLVAYTAAQDKNLTMGGTGFSFNGPKGVTVGGGVETTLSKNMTMSLEYRHTAFDTSNVSVLPVTFDTTENSVRVGLAYHFGSVPGY